MPLRGHRRAVAMTRQQVDCVSPAMVFINEFMKIQSLICVCLAAVFAAQAQEIDAKLLELPRIYTARKTTGTITVDGKADEAQWSKADWTVRFSDITYGEEKPAAYTTRGKMLWDDSYVYLYVEFEEPHVWATLKAHDSSVFQDNALEVFIDPDDDMHNYVEFQINAFTTVWDLIMNLPYRNGGRPLSDWDIKGLQKAVYVDGTLNNPADEDRGWSIELAFPIKSILGSQRGAIKPGDYWRMNFSRVQRETEVENGQYRRKTTANGRPLAPDYWVWSPVGIVNLHYPERMGYVLFAGDDDNSHLPLTIDNAEENARKELWKYYYVQQAYLDQHGGYAADLETLREAYSADQLATDAPIALFATPYQFLLRYTFPNGQYVAIDHLGKVSKGKVD